MKKVFLILVLFSLIMTGFFWQVLQKGLKKGIILTKEVVY